MRLCLSNEITGIRLREHSTEVAGARGGPGAEENNGSPPDTAEGQSAGNCPLPPAQASLWPGPWSLCQQCQRGEASRLRREGLLPVSIYANELIQVDQIVVKICSKSKKACLRDRYGDTANTNSIVLPRVASTKRGFSPGRMAVEEGKAERAFSESLEL